MRQVQKNTSTYIGNISTVPHASKLKQHGKRKRVSKLKHVGTIPEPVFLNVYGAQESIPRHQFRQPM